MRIPNIPIADHGPADAIFTVDNAGNFLYTPNEPNPRPIQLERYFDLRMQEIRRRRGVRDLNETDMRALQDEFQHIQNYVGHAILTAQQRR